MAALVPVRVLQLRAVPAELYAGVLNIRQVRMRFVVAGFRFPAYDLVDQVCVVVVLFHELVLGAVPLDALSLTACHALVGLACGHPGPVLNSST
eukprot:7258795-Alexandrium_andersonii.AAC.1